MLQMKRLLNIKNTRVKLFYGNNKKSYRNDFDRNHLYNSKIGFLVELPRLHKAFKIR